MINPKKFFNQSITSYHNDPRILFQFILSEVFAAFKIGLSIDAMCTKEKKGNGESIFMLMSSLIDGEQDRQNMCWNSKKGVLIKLKNYCAYFLVIHSDHAQAQLMLQKVNKAVQLCLECADIFDPFHKHAEDSLLYEDLKKLTVSIRRIAKVCGGCFEHFLLDENILFYVLRHTSDLDACFGKGFTKKLLLRQFPQGILSLGSFLHFKYSQRGFHHLMPIISNKIAELAAR